MNDDRIDRLEARLSALEQRVGMPQAPRPMPQPPGPAPVAAVPVMPKPSSVPSPRVERSFEALIAGRGLQIAGALLVLIGCAFFLDLAFAQGWIGPAERIVLGLAVGTGIVLFGARRVPPAYCAIAEAIIGLGAGILYLSLWASVQSFPELHVSRVAVFAAMIAVTAVLGALAGKRRSQPIALFGAVGGFLTPVLLSGDTPDLVVLAAYLLVLALGALVLAARYGFGLLEVATLVGVFAFAGTFAPDPDGGWSIAAAQIVATLFFLVFAIAISLGTAAGAQERRKAALLAASVGGYATILELLFADVPTTLGIDLLLLSAALLGAAQIRPLNRALAGTYGYLALGTISLALAALLKGETLLDAFSIEAALLFFIGSRTPDRWMTLAAGLALAALGVAVVTLASSDAPHDAWSFATASALWLACAGAVLFARRNAERNPSYGLFSDAARIGFDIVAVVALSRVCFDILGGSGSFEDASSSAQFAVSFVWTAYAAGLFLYGLRRRLGLLRWEALALFACTILKVFSVDLSSVQLEWRVLSFIVLGAVLFGISATYTRSMAKSSGTIE